MTENRKRVLAQIGVALTDGIAELVGRDDCVERIRTEAYYHGMALAILDAANKNYSAGVNVMDSVAEGRAEVESVLARKEEE